MKYDFGGWATRNNLRCSDGLTIMQNAFQENDGKKVPLIWNHGHNDPSNVLGHAILENRDEGVYAYCSFNDTPSARDAKNMVAHGDINALSIYANQLKKQGTNVMHGQIREVSLVLAGANPGAYIDDVVIHGELQEDQGVIFTGEPLQLEITHADKTNKGGETTKMDNKQTTQTDNSQGKTIQEVFDTLNEEQQNMVYALVGAAVDEERQQLENGGSVSQSEINEEGGEEMKHNVFNQNEENNAGGDVLTHSEMMAVIADGKRCGSLREAAIAHGITNIDYLFPDFKNVTDVPGFIQRPNT